MKRKPMLGLQLFTSSSSFSSSEFDTDHSLTCSSTRNQQITIFCKAQAGDCDISELQALAILWHARREMEEKYNISGPNSRTPSLQFQLHSPYGLSLRKSLQRFLQKRRDRIQGATPY